MGNELCDAIKRYKPAHIVAMLREAEVELSKGAPIAVAVKNPGRDEGDRRQ
jgi:hypothetical protein